MSADITSFRDVLDVPAIKSSLAAKTLLNGITHAGKRLVSVGQRGHIVYSDDNGKSWIQANVPVSSDLLGVNFPTAEKGWAVGHDGVVLHSSDGGVNWIKQFDGRAAVQVMASHYMAGAKCTSCHAQVAPQRSGKPGGAVAATLMQNVKRLVDQGPDKPFLDVWFENERNGFIVGAFNLIFHTSDGGKIWEPWFDRTENPKLLHLYAMRAIGSDVYVCGEQGLVMKLDRKAGKFRNLNVP